MSKKNNKQRRLKQHKTMLEVNAEREAKAIAKMNEARADPKPEDEWVDEPDVMDEERCDEHSEEGDMKNELPNKKISKKGQKVKFKIFQRRVLIQERKRARKARKNGVVIFTKSMHTE